MTNQCHESNAKPECFSCFLDQGKQELGHGRGDPVSMHREGTVCSVGRENHQQEECYIPHEGEPLMTCVEHQLLFSRPNFECVEDAE